jgi:Na+/H+ antiporter NhaD/arsenite permease-like protein
VEGARRRGLKVSFLDYAAVDVPITLLTTAFGVWWLSLRLY